MMREIGLNFEGYWTEAAEQFLPDKSGVFCVYRARVDMAERRIYLRQLIYIGESEKVRRKIRSHSQKAFWREHLRAGESLCYSFAPITIDRNRAEAALIHEHRPPENYEYCYDFPFPDTAVFLTGKTVLLSPCFAALKKGRSLSVEV